MISLTNLLTRGGGIVLPPPLDIAGIPISMAYGIRRLRTAYAGPAIRVRRSTDNAVADIGLTPAGDLDVNIANVFRGRSEWLRYAMVRPVRQQPACCPVSCFPATTHRQYRRSRDGEQPSCRPLHPGIAHSPDQPDIDRRCA